MSTIRKCKKQKKISKKHNQVHVIGSSSLTGGEFLLGRQPYPVHQSCDILHFRSREACKNLHGKGPTSQAKPDTCHDLVSMQ